MNNDILPFWQEIGTSTSIIAKKVSEKLKTPTSHTGTLDPMASGVVLILKGDEYFNKEKYIQDFKTYTFDILFGFSTDTHDGLGIIQDYIKEDLDFNLEEFENILNSFVGYYSQRYPEFSSKKINGKSLWEYKRLGLPVPEVFINGEIKEINLKNYEFVESAIEIENICKQIKLISGNFRQDEILQKYGETKFHNKFLKINLEVKMSRGLYVRGLVRDISNKINIPGIVINLVRTAEGDFTKNDCRLLSEYFAEELKVNPNFFSPEFKNLNK